MKVLGTILIVVVLILMFIPPALASPLSVSIDQSVAASAGCAQESMVVTGSTSNLADGRVLDVNVPIPSGFNSLMFDGQEAPTGSHVLRIFGLPVTEWPHMPGGTWYAICGEPLDVAGRITNSSTQVWDMRPGVPVLVSGPGQPGPAPVPSTPSAPQMGPSTITSAWPSSPAAAAQTFGGTADRWEVSADGGWHLIEAHSRTTINPQGFFLEGYWDTAPGKDPIQIVTNASVDIQGGTIWQADGPTLLCAMWSQKFGRFGFPYSQAQTAIQVVGFTAPASCN